MYEYTGTGASTSTYAGSVIRRSEYASDNSVLTLLGDHLGSTSAMVDATGAVVAQQYYYPYGANRGGAQSNLTERRYTGQYHETGLAGAEGLYYYNARWYDPAIGRFVQADTIVPSPGNPQSRNRYAYVLGNPLKYVDPTGRLHDPSADYLAEPWRISYNHLSSHPGYREAWLAQDSRWRWAGEDDYQAYLALGNWLGNGTLIREYRNVSHLLARAGDLLAQVGNQTGLYGPGLWFSREADPLRWGPDGTIISFGGHIWEGAGAWTAADVVLFPSAYSESEYTSGDPAYKALVNHEYCHVLQVRSEGALHFYRVYGWQVATVWALKALGYDTDIHTYSPYERDIAEPVQLIYQANPNLPSIWEFPN